MNGEKSLFEFLGSLVLSILGLWFLYVILRGAGVGIPGYYGGGYEHMGYGYAGAGLLGSTSFILLLLIKLLFVLLVIGLVVGIVLIIKNYLFTKDDVEKIKGAFVKAEVIKESCNACGKELEEHWKNCPYCGKEKTKEEKSQEEKPKKEKTKKGE